MISPERTPSTPPRRTLGRLQNELSESLRIALEQLRVHKVRAALTALGVIIGIVAVTLMGAAIQAIDRGFSDSMAMLGTDTFYIERWPWRDVGDDWIKYRNRPELRPENAERFNRLLAEVPNSTIELAVPSVVTFETVARGDRSIGGAYTHGTNADFERINTASVLHGRFFTAPEAVSGRNVVLLGYEVANVLFPEGMETAVGQTVHIRQVRFTVIGVLSRQGSFLGMQSFDNQVILPLPALRKFYSGNWSNHLRVLKKPTASLSAARDEITGLMRTIRALEPGEDNDFEVNQSEAIEDQLGPIKKGIAIAGFFITGLALFVGAIGIMNITFVSVKERTREIGTRRALGARRLTILSQFLIEAVSICLLGGVLGLALALSLLVGLAHAFPNFPLGVGPSLIAFAVILSVLTGVFSGFAPAWQAPASIPPPPCARSDMEPQATSRPPLRRRTLRGADLLRLSVTSLGSNKLRSGLTVLGIAIGVFSVVGVMTALSAVNKSITTGLNVFGTNVFQISREPALQFDGGDQSWRRRPQITPAQGYEFARRMQVETGCVVTTWARDRFAWARFEDKRTSPKYNIVGTNENYLETNKYDLEQGRNLGVADVEFNIPVVVLGHGMREELFPNQDPLGHDIILEGFRYRVIGVLAKRGDLFGENLDNLALVPISRFVDNHWNWRRSMRLSVQAPSAERFEATRETALGIMRQIRGLGPGKENDFDVFSNESLQEQFAKISLIVGTGGLLISAIALVCAGVGIMNIMLVSVTERTREIGVRLSLGARRRDILRQFLLEALFLALIGAAVGILGGMAVGNTAAHFMKAEVIVPWFWIGAAVGVCSAIGIGFGYLPAWRAANLDPVEALRHE